MRTGKWQFHTAQKDANQPGRGGWSNAGFHRPLAGMLILLPLNMLLYFLLVRYRLYTLPDILAPSPNIFSSWQFVEHWAEVIWLLLDAGTGIAAVRYFASLHVRHPRRAFSYFQFYGWWQLFIGAVQLGVVALLSATVIPGASFAHLTYFILIQSIIRFPGFLTVFVLLFRAMQRLDYEQYLTFFLTYGSVAFQALAYLIYTRWGAALPAIEQNQINIVGLGAGLYVAEWFIFILGMFLYHRQGYKIKALLIPISDTQVSRQILSFGIRAAFGTLAVPLGTLIQIYILDNRLPELNPVWRNWIIAIQIAYIFDLLLQQFYRNMIPALSEAVALNYKTLLRYYVTQGVRYGMWLSVFIFAVFAALGQHIVDIIHTGTYFQVAEVLLLLLAVAVFRWGIWLVDALMLASERPGLSSALTILEQILTIGGGLFLAPRGGMLGFLSAYAVAFLIRTLLSWILMQRLIVRVHIYIWQTLVSPLFSGMLIYYLLHVMLKQITPTWQTGFVFAALLIGLWIYALFTALFGGWDDTNIRELGRAVRLSGIGKPYAWILWQCIRLGAWISPLHGRFPVVIASIAEEQAIAITYTRSATR
jgi:O-antigen/teichoic acid export membrane protein